ncbi:sensor histidine kinase [Variovorax paradoxus]|uniref:sensor histidine kinase n=1 Tax=Variovorax paradoxus TaxID=34073 RepID=UPI001ABC1979
MSAAAMLKVSPHVLVQLGSELVTDVDQALLECVKNSYDADSVGCKIIVDTRKAGEIVDKSTAQRLLAFDQPAENVQVELRNQAGHRIDLTALRRPILPDERITRHLHYTGKITIEDTGEGIPPEKIASSWLMISGSIKRSQGSGPKSKTRKGRTPLGDKGLGRLGTMKLGDILEVESAVAPNLPLSVARFRWKDCDSAVTVDQVPVMTTSRPNLTGFKGTRVNIFGLRDLPEWRRKDRAAQLASSLAKLVSPFEATSTFPVKIQVDDGEQSLSTVTETLLSQAIAQFDFSWEKRKDGTMELVARARFMTRLFTSARSKTQKDKADLAFNADSGAGFREFLDDFKRTKAYEKHKPKRQGGFVEFVRRYSWIDLMMKSEADIADPGQLSGAFYFFHLDARDAAGDEAAAGLGTLARQIKNIAGISLLRDGFRVRSDGDWLGLSLGMTSGSIYHMRVNNTVGYFALTGEKNFLLVEKSDREGFVDNAAYRGFYVIGTTCRDFANDALEDVRRGLDEYYKLLKSHQSNLPPTDPIQFVEDSVAASDAAQAAAKKAADELTAELKALEAHPNSSASPRTTKALAIARKALMAVTQSQTSIPTRQSLRAAIERVRDEREESQDQLLALYESAAVGLSARGLAHELRTHVSDMRQRMTAMVQAAKAEALDEKMLATHVRAMRDSCSAILSAASMIDPMLPRSRMLKETFDVADFAAEYVSHRRHEFLREDVKVTPVGGPLVVRMNKARLLQVLDNLVRNSIYWLRRGHASGKISRAKAISIEIGESSFAVADSGPGVDPSYENSLFEIFVTGKPKESGEGQGLGLYIVKQLLAADGCDIFLSGERNPEGNRYRFSVDLARVCQ